MSTHRGLAGRVALVTGGSGGLGRGIARELGRAGARDPISAQRRLTRHLAAELAPFRITANAVAADLLMTPRAERIPTPELTARRLQQIPAGRLGTLDDVAAAVCFLACPAAGGITGAILDVNGGSLML